MSGLFPEPAGQAAGLLDVLWTLSADCPRRGSISQPCGARYVGLGAKG